MNELTFVRSIFNSFPNHFAWFQLIQNIVAVEKGVFRFYFDAIALKTNV